MDIPQPMLQAAIAALEPHVQHPGTGALHDPLYAMLQGDGEGALEALARALTTHSAHPAAAQIRAQLSVHVDLPEPSLEAVLAQHGAYPDGDPVSEAARLLEDGATTRRVLSARVQSLEIQAQSLSRTANAMAAVGAMVAIFGAIGWLVALGWLEISWIESPIPERPQDAAAGRGAAGSGEQRVR